MGTGLTFDYLNCDHKFKQRNGYTRGGRQIFICRGCNQRFIENRLSNKEKWIWVGRLLLSYNMEVQVVHNITKCSRMTIRKIRRFLEKNSSIPLS